MIRTGLALLLAAICALCLWLVATSSEPVEFALSLGVLTGFAVAAAWAAARRAA